MVHPTELNSNRLFETLADWDSILKGAGLCLDLDL